MKLTSIIMTAWIQDQPYAHLTMASIANVTRYTDPDEYEFILMSDTEKFPVRDDYKVLKIDQYVKTEGWGYTKCMNEGAKLAKGDYLVFLQNDVFVWEGWLPKLRYYLDNNIADCVIPDQMPRSREFVKESYAFTPEQAMKYGSRDAGLLMITREAFEKTGGWDEDLSILAERDFYNRIAKSGIRQIDTCSVMISHIMGATNNTYGERWDKLLTHDAQKLNT